MKIDKYDWRFNVDIERKVIYSFGKINLEKKYP